MKVIFCCVFVLYMVSLFIVRLWTIKRYRHKLDKVDLLFILTPIVNTFVILLAGAGLVKRISIKFIKWFINA